MRVVADNRDATYIQFVAAKATANANVSSISAPMSVSTKIGIRSWGCATDDAIATAKRMYVIPVMKFFFNPRSNSWLGLIHRWKTSVNVDMILAAEKFELQRNIE